MLCVDGYVLKGDVTVNYKDYKVKGLLERL